MATVTAHVGIDMASFDVWYGYVTTATGSTIRVENYGQTATCRGSFSYDWDGEVYGRLDSFTETYYGSTRFAVTGIDRNANTVLSYIDQNDDVGLLSYVLSGNDRLVGSAQTDRLQGLGGGDAISGNGGNDWLEGGSGDDWLRGDAGNDRLDGGSGNDRLIGGAGKDHMFGRSGTDDFVFLTQFAAGKWAGRDVIRDFQRGADDIDLASIDASAAHAGNQAFKFIGAKAFSGAAGELRFKNDLVEGDVNADKLADFQIEVTGHTVLGWDDFLL